jgi:hypothetical protein
MYKNCSFIGIGLHLGRIGRVSIQCKNHNIFQSLTRLRHLANPTIPGQCVGRNGHELTLILSTRLACLPTRRSATVLRPVGRHPIVAWHEVPGSVLRKTRPVGFGMIGASRRDDTDRSLARSAWKCPSEDPSRRVRYDRRGSSQRYFSSKCVLLK